MNVACIMDPLKSINYEKDTSYYLLLAAQELGHNIYHIDQDDIYLKHTQPHADCTPIEVSADKKFSAKEKVAMSLSDMQLILVRKDPPFDRRFFYTTLLLDMLPPSTKVSNSPQSLRDWNEKLSALEFPEFCPPTLVSSRLKDFKNFASEQSTKLVIKPLDGNGGKGIKFIEPGASDFDQVFQESTNNFSHKILVQKYVPETRDGDVRVLFVNDQILGGFIRKSAEGQELNNLDQGGTAHPWELTPQQKVVCEKMAPAMFKKGVSFVGIDFLGDYLIEINVTSATGLQELSKFNNQKLHHHVIKTLLG